MLTHNKKIILFIPNGIGDVLMSLPLIRRLLFVLPSSSLAIVVSNPIQKKLLEHAINSDIKIFCRFNEKLFSHISLLFNIIFFNANICFAPLISSKFFNKVFFLFSFTKTVFPWGVNVNHWPNLVENKFRLDTFGGHQVNYFLSFVGDYFSFFDTKVASFSEMTVLPHSTKQKKNGARTLIAFGISCGILERHKIPSPHVFAKIANRLSIDAPIDIIVFGSANDLSLLDQFEAALNSSIELTRVIDLPLHQLIFLLSSCDLGVCGTTGHGHMMAAASLPVLVLSGVTNELESGPYTEIVGVVKHDLTCGPCYRENYRFGCGEIVCMDLIDPDLASRHVRSFLANNLSRNKLKASSNE